MNKYVITLESSQANNAGPKAKADVEQFLTETDYQILPLKVNLDPADKSFGAKLRRSITVNTISLKYCNKVKQM